MNKYLLKLYVSGHTWKSKRAVENLRRICEARLGRQYRLEVIDVLESPQVAEEHKILATPTLVKEMPPPARRIIGDLSEENKVVAVLELASFTGIPSGGGREE